MHIKVGFCNLGNLVKWPLWWAMQSYCLTQNVICQLCSQVTETMEVHCGFCSEESIFHIEQEDKAFLQSCEAVVTTCNFGGGDDLFQPINMTHASLAKVDFRCLQ